MDNLFKALLIIILGAFLYLYYENSDNNRYQNMSRPDAVSTIRLLDTKTGKVYMYGSVFEGGKAYYINDLPNAKIEEKIGHTESIKSIKWAK